MSAGLSYKDAGVDLERYREAMSRLPRLMRRTHTPRVIDLPGGFAGLFRLDYNSRLFAKNYRDPVLVACTDGVGTKLRVAATAGRHDTVGIDLVAMCVNDALCVGAEPLFFLDYVAMAADDPPLLEQIVTGITAGCLEADCALLGGETAIHPPDDPREPSAVSGRPPTEYDLAGFCVGVVERRRLVDGRTIRPGDAVLGLASSGLHSNGFSLARKAVFERAGLRVDDFVPELSQTVGAALLEPTRIYVRPILEVLKHYRVKTVVRGLAHITGGGLVENVSRVLPPGVKVEIHAGSWPVPAVFDWIARLGDIEPAEMAATFNMGIGFALVVSPYFAESILRQLAEQRVPGWVIGEVREQR